MAADQLLAYLVELERDMRNIMISKRRIGSRCLEISVKHG